MTVSTSGFIPCSICRPHISFCNNHLSRSPTITSFTNGPRPFKILLPAPATIVLSFFSIFTRSFPLSCVGTWKFGTSTRCNLSSPFFNFFSNPFSLTSSRNSLNRGSALRVLALAKMTSFFLARVKDTLIRRQSLRRSPICHIFS